MKTTTIEHEMLTAEEIKRVTATLSEEAFDAWRNQYADAMEVMVRKFIAEWGYVNALIMANAVVSVLAVDVEKKASEPSRCPADTLIAIKVVVEATRTSKSLVSFTDTYGVAVDHAAHHAKEDAATGEHTTAEA